MRVVVAVVGLVLIIAVGVAYGLGWPPALFGDSQVSAVAPGPAQRETNVTRYSNVRGLQDAPRDDAAQGTVFDMKHCMQTMTLRQLKPADAQHTCTQLIDGISRM